MKIPTENFSIKIGPLSYEVIYSKDVTWEQDSYGTTHNAHEKIFLSPDYSQQKREVTFLHEVMHACFEVGGLNHRFGVKTIEQMPTDEDVVRDLAMVFYGVMKDNPTIFSNES